MSSQIYMYLLEAAIWLITIVCLTVICLKRLPFDALFSNKTKLYKPYLIFKT